MGFTLSRLIREHAASRPRARALTCDGRTLDYGELDARSSRVAGMLRDRGIGPGDRVAILEKNSLAFFEILVGCSKVGAVLVALNWRLAPPEIASILEDAQARLLYAGVEQLPLLAGAAAGMPRIVTDTGYEELVAGAEAPGDLREPSPDDVLLQLYTSGTTGRPKGAMLTHANLGYTVRLGREAWRMGPRSVNLIASPLFHIGGAGYSMTALGQGAHTILLRQSDPAAILDAVERHRVTHSWFVPSVIQSLVEAADARGADLSSLEILGYGGAPISESLLLRAMDRLGCGFLGVYGMTETASTVLVLPPEDHDPGGPRAHLLRSVGRPPEWVEISIRDPSSGAEVGPDRSGEIWVRSPQNMLGYWRQPEATAQTLVDGGWLRTGDGAHRDGDGYVHLHDRIKDMIISGGENIYPAEVEAVLADHPGVAEVAVIAVPHEKWGETPRAVVVPRNGAAPPEADLIAFARDRLAHYKCPTSVAFVDALPRNASGKVLKHILREPHWRGVAGAR